MHFTNRKNAPLLFSTRPGGTRPPGRPGPEDRRTPSRPPRRRCRAWCGSPRPCACPTRTQFGITEGCAENSRLLRVRSTLGSVALDTSRCPRRSNLALCARFVTVSSANGSMVAHSGCKRRHAGRRSASISWRTSAHHLADLKILVSGVQSPPCPPFLHGFSERPFPRCHWNCHRVESRRGRHSERRREFRPRLAEVTLGHDRVAPVDGLGLVAGELHRDGARDTGTLEVPDRRAPKVVERSPGCRRSCRPSSTLGERLDRLPVAVEHVADDPALRALPVWWVTAWLGVKLVRIILLLEQVARPSCGALR